MTLVISKGITLAKANNGIVDPDAIIYINNVEKADGENLEYATAKAIHDFVVGCKADGIWSAIKASCILAGARTLAGALVPLVGAAPTNFNFAPGDYNRKTGLVGDGSTKYLDSNRNNNADPQDSKHISIQVSALNAGPGGVLIDAGAGATGASNLYTSLLVNYGSRVNSSFSTTSGVATGFFGVSRSNSSQYSRRFNATTNTVSSSSQAPFNGNFLIYKETGVDAYSSPRLSFYSIGESLNLTQLDARVTDLINAFGAAIP